MDLGWIGVNLESVGVDLGQSWCNLGWLWGNLGQTGCNLQRSGAVWGQIWGLLAPFAAHSWHFPTSSAPFSSVSLPQIPSFPKIALFPPQTTALAPSWSSSPRSGTPTMTSCTRSRPSSAPICPRRTKRYQNCPQKTLFSPNPTLPYPGSLGGQIWGCLRWVWGWIWGRLGGLGAVWGHFRGIWGSFGAMLGGLGIVWVAFGAFWGHFGWL